MSTAQYHHMLQPLFQRLLGQNEADKGGKIEAPILTSMINQTLKKTRIGQISAFCNNEIEHIFTSMSNTKKTLLKLVDINIKGQHCGVDKVFFLCEFCYTKYYKYQVQNLYAHTESIFYEQSNLFNYLLKSLYKFLFVNMNYYFFGKGFFCFFVFLGCFGFNFVFFVSV